MQDLAHPETIDVFIGVDVGKGQHHAVALNRGGKQLLERPLFLSAFAALRDPVSCAYYDRKVIQGKRHNIMVHKAALRVVHVVHAGRLFEVVRGNASKPVSQRVKISLGRRCRSGFQRHGGERMSGVGRACVS